MNLTEKKAAREFLLSITSDTISRQNNDSEERGIHSLHTNHFEFKNPKYTSDTNWELLPHSCPSIAADDISDTLLNLKDDLFIRYGALWSIPYYYYPLIESLLKSANNSYKNKAEFKEAMHETLAGKTVIEIGARAGGFLKYLKQYGCSVYGTTDSRYFNKAQKLLGEGNIRNGDYLSSADVLSDVKADYIFGFNQFINNRWQLKKCPINEMLVNYKLLSKSATKSFIMPAAGSKSVLSVNKLKRMYLSGILNRLTPYRRPYWQHLRGAHGPNNVVFEIGFNSSLKNS